MATPFLGLYTCDTTSGCTTKFLDWRLQVAGTSSNMSIIDNCAAATSASIVALQGIKSVVYVPALYVSPSYYEATGITDITSYSTNQIIDLSLDTANTGTITLNINGLGTKTLVKIDNSGSGINFAAADIKKGKENLFRYNGSQWVWISANSMDQINAASGSNGNIIWISGSVLADSGYGFNGTSGVPTMTSGSLSASVIPSHAHSTTKYGYGDSTNYGHIKSGEGLTSSSGLVSINVSGSGTPIILSGSKVSHNVSGVSSGSYNVVLVDTYGHITSGSNTNTGAIIQSNGSSLLPRQTYLDFTGTAISVANSTSTSSTNVTINLGGHVIQSNGSSLTSRSYLNFSGNGVTTRDNTNGSSTDIIIDSSAFVNVNAGETLKNRDCVFLAIENTVNKTAGRAYKTNADTAYTSSESWITGFTTGSSSSGNPVNIQISGSLSGFTGLTAGGVYYISNTAGSITKTKPAANARIIGIGLYSEGLLINNRGSNDAVSSMIATYGYFAGGTTGAVQKTTDRIVFSTGVTTANTASNLSASRLGLGGVSDTRLYGYFAGGYITATVTTADIITFSTGVTAANTVSNLTISKQVFGSVSDGINYGYFAGGSGSVGAMLFTTDRIAFSSGITAANTVSNLSLARGYLAGLSDVVNYGYFAGGYTVISVANADRIVFSTGVTSANTVSNLSVARYDIDGISDNYNYGYFAGGNTEAVVATAERIVFSTGATAANTVSNLSQARSALATSSSGDAYGYFSGGITSGAVATSDRITFSTGATAANTVSNLSQARNYLDGISDGAV